MTSPALCIGIFAGAQPGIFQDSYSVSPPLILGGILPLHTTCWWGVGIFFIPRTTLNVFVFVRRGVG